MNGGFIPEEYLDIYRSFNDLLAEISDTFSYGFNIAQLGLSGAILILSILAVLFSALIAILLFVVEAIPVYSLSKKLDRRFSFLAWIPVFSRYLRFFILCDLAGDKPFSVFGGKLKFKSRLLAFWIYLGFALGGNAIITLLMLFVNVIPYLGQILGGMASLLYLVPKAACGIIEFAMLRDLLDIFKPDRKSNKITAIVIAALDGVVFGGLAWNLYIYSLLKSQPLADCEQ